jgi:hypothetical protein
MRRIITTLLALGMTAGVASADNWHDRDGDHHRDRDHERVNGRVNVDVHARVTPRRVEVIHYRDHHHRPEMRVERHEFRRGFIWVGGEWMWRYGEWQWVPGHYVVRR